MKKLIKYEFLKNKVSILISLSCLALIELIFILNYFSKNDAMAIISFVFLFMGCYLCDIFGLILGSKSFTKELNDKSGYMVYMTPNNYYTIIGSKYIFALLLQIIYMLVTIFMIILNLFVFIGDPEEIKEIVEDLLSLFTQIDTYEVLLAILFVFILFVLYTTCVISFYNICYTFSCTFIQNSHGRKWITSLIFIIGGSILIRANYLIPNIESYNVSSAFDVFVACVPHYLYCAVLILASLFGTAYMLEKKISL